MDGLLAVSEREAWHVWNSNVLAIKIVDVELIAGVINDILKHFGFTSD